MADDSVKFEIKVNDHGLVAQLDAFPGLKAEAISRALNRTAEWTKTRLVKLAEGMLTVKVADIRTSMSIRRANPGDLAANVHMSGHRIRLFKFKGQATSPISYQITKDGGRKTIAHNAFTAIEKGEMGFWRRVSTHGEHKKVIAKTGKRAGKFIWSEYKIAPLFGPSTVKVVEDSKEYKTLQVDSEQRLELQLDREASFILTGTSKLPAEGALMPEILSIKERIERLYVAIIQGIDGIGTVYRWDGRGLRDPETGKSVGAQGERLSLQNLDAMIVAADEPARDGGQGNDDSGTTIKTLPIEVHLKIVQADDDAENGSFVHNRWLLRLEAAVMANPLMIEDGDDATPMTGQRLATDTATTDTGQPPREEGQRESITAIRFETQYEHDRNDPAAGAGITHKTI